MSDPTRPVPQHSPEDVLIIAKSHKGILWCLLGFLASHALQVAQPNDYGAVVVFLLVVPFGLYFTYRLASRLKAGLPILYCIAMFLPCVNLLSLVYLSSQATAVVRAYGVPVGLMGANIAALEARLRESE
jgi:exosortase/archaeosortase